MLLSLSLLYRPISAGFVALLGVTLVTSPELNQLLVDYIILLHVGGHELVPFLHLADPLLVLGIVKVELNAFFHHCYTVYFAQFFFVES